MESLSLVVIGVISFFLLIKYKSIGIIYALILLLPFRLELFSFNGVGIRITDILALTYLFVWIIKILSRSIMKSDIRLSSRILIFLLVVIMSFLVNVLRFGAMGNLIDLIRLILAITTGIAISTTIRNEFYLLRLFLVWATSATLSSLISIVIFFSEGNGISTLYNLNNLSVVEFYAIKFSNSIFFEDPNNLASYLLISIFITLGLGLGKHIPIKYKYFMLAVQVLGLVLTMSRSAYLAFGLAILIFMFVYKTKGLKWMLLKVLVVALVFIEAISFLRVFDSDVSMMSRIGLWQVGVNMTISNPIIGVGIGNSSILFREYINSLLVLYNPHFHNLFLTISSEVGIIGLFSFFSIFRKNLLDWRKSSDVVYVFLVLGLIAYLVQSIGVEYFASRHFWIFVPLLIQYNSFISKRGRSDGISISSTARL